MSLRVAKLATCLVAALLVLIAGPAAAQGVCDALRSQLAQIDQGGNGQQAAYDQLVAQLNATNAQYAQVYAQAQQMGCIVLFQRFAPAQCQGILPQLNQLEANVTALDRAVRQASRGQTIGARANILSAMRINNCPLQAPRANTYRTLCVRPADGFYYPLNYATTPDRFEADATICAQQCEGATLYVHRNPGEEVEAAVNLDGGRYVDLPQAFAYRTSIDPANVCHPTPELQAVIDQLIAEANFDGALQITVTAALVPLPIPRPVATEDPETLANRTGGFVLGETPLPTAPTIADAGATTVRLIGPAYYYAR